MTFPAAVFFDWDGTLVDTIPLLRRAHNHVRNFFGHPDWSEAEFRSNLKHSSRDLYPRVYADDADQAMDILYQYIEDNHLNELQAFPKAMDIVHYLNDQNIPMGVISNKKHQYLVKEIDAMGLSDIITIIYGSGSLPYDKPSGKPILAALNDARVEPHSETVWYVGDTDTDMLAAQDAKVAPVLVAESPRKETLEQQYSPFLSFHTCKDLHDWLRQCNQSNS